jgi:hypothetical protein
MALILYVAFAVKVVVATELYVVMEDCTANQTEAGRERE